MQDKQELGKTRPADFFTKDVSESYDAKNRGLAPIADNMHFLIRLALQDLPDNARILCVGVGTGAEILSLARAYPGWSFVGVDPSAPMLDVCRNRLQDAGIADRCTLVHGYVHDTPDDAAFDAVLSILVGHFVPREDRVVFYTDMQKRLKPDGYLVNTEISFDLDSDEFPAMLDNWKRVQTIMGATPASLQSLSVGLRDVLCVLPPSETEQLLRASGIAVPVQFFQSFMIRGWIGQRG